MKHRIIMIMAIFAASLLTASVAVSGNETLPEGYHPKGPESGIPVSGQHSLEPAGSQQQGAQQQGVEQQTSQWKSGQQNETVQLRSEQIREMQSLLKEQGYQVGAVDGIIGPNTRGAIRQFQSDQDLAVTGNPNKQTLRALAPSAEKQEFFGLSPEYGEREGMQEHRGMQGQEGIQEHRGAQEHEGMQERRSFDVEKEQKTRSY